MAKKKGSAADKSREESIEDLSEASVDENAANDVRGGSFLTLGGVKGESTDNKHKQQIEIES